MQGDFLQNIINPCAAKTVFISFQANLLKENTKQICNIYFGICSVIQIIQFGRCLF